MVMHKDLENSDASILRKALDVIPGIVFIRDNTGKIVFTNSAYASYFKLAPEEMIGRYQHELYEVAGWDQPLIADWLEEDREVVRSGEPLVLEEKIVHKNGETRWYKTDKIPIELSDGETAVLVVSQNITDYVNAQLVLKESEERYSELFNATPHALIVIDADMNVVLWNPAAERIFGYTADEMVGKSMQALIPESRRNDVEKALSNIVTHDKNEFAGITFEEKILRKDGVYQSLEFTIRPRMKGNAVIATVSVSDIDERKKLVEQVLDSQKLEAIGRLAGGIAHDFNNILSGILGYCELIEEDIIGHGIDADSQIIKDLKEIMNSANRAVDLTSRLLAFSKHQAISPVDLSLSKVIIAIAKLLRRIIGGGIDLKIIHGKHLDLVSADPGQIEQVLLNLAINARDAMPEGGKLTIETENVEVTEAYCEAYPWVNPGRFVLLAISDTGLGMSQDVLDHIFEPFFTTKDVSEGVGLGLATVYGIVRQHEGMLIVKSEIGKGSTFKVYLPAMEKHS